MVYDGNGNRVSQTARGITTQYLVDDVNPSGYAQVVEELVGGMVQRTSTYGRDLSSQNRLAGSTWTPSYDLVDGLGSVRTLADASGSATDSSTYDAFGTAIASSGSTSNRYGFTGEPFDADLGLYYLRARYYNTGSGRFWSHGIRRRSIRRIRASGTAMSTSRRIRSMRLIQADISLRKQVVKISSLEKLQLGPNRLGLR